MKTTYLLFLSISICIMMFTLVTFEQLLVNIPELSPENINISICIF